MQGGYDSPLALSRGTLATDWERFRRYANLIRSITYRYNFYSTIRTLGQTRNLFPNLQSLRIIDHTARSLYGGSAPADPPLIQEYVPFMQPSVTHFIVESLDWNKAGMEWANTISRMSHLVCLEIKGGWVDEDFVVLAARNLPCLETLVLPFLAATSVVIEGLSNHQYLKEIKSNSEPQLRERFTGLPTFEPRLNEGAFPALHTLACAAWSRDFPHFLAHKFFPSNLRGVYLETLDLTTASSVESILLVLAKTCPDIEKITLTDEDYNPWTSGACAGLSLDPLRPLFSCTKITSLHIRHRTCLALTHEEVGELARALPHIEHLILNEEPRHRGYQFESHSLTLDILPIFADSCRHLQSLGVYIDANAPYSTDLFEVQPFYKLQNIYMGKSTMDYTSIEPIALFFAQILPPMCKIHPQSDTISQTNYWLSINRLLPVLVKMKEIGVRIGKRLQ
ncbi:hypothetical protein Hypma_005454 [Hypsizygus marmoreus]|uniref:F-box domain-containing protein n=1 Tax=Hypsizygus marmoreus TaxID=39966 RepID=A0A369IZ71_HYPMA|nr:hypothetical protein Hypma_005454 [Hypsizygus marmoreus]